MAALQSSSKSMKQITFVFGTRPELIKVAPVIKAARGFFRTKIISTGQHKELLSNLYDWFEIKPDIDLEVMQANQSPGQVIANILDSLDPHIKDSDFVLVQGDTASAYAGAMAAFLQKIPVAHLEAGLRTDNIYNPFPEEMLRRLVSQLTSIHLAPTQAAVANLQKENFGQNLHLVGNTVIDSLKSTLGRLQKIEQENPNKLKSLTKLPELELENKKLILVTMHRRENLGSEHEKVAKALRKIALEFPEVVIVFPVHPNPSVKNAIQPHLVGLNNVCLIEPLDYVSFSWLLMKSYILVTDSGGLQEEGCFLGKPTLVLRQTTERPEAIEAGVAKLVGTEEKTVYEEVQNLLQNKKAYKLMAKGNSAFGEGNSAEKIMKILNGFEI
jgi:UDP-N-acetylglucosamine 2-epimerase (non-hydrolysing)